MGERRGTKALELWCRRMVDGYPGVKIDNMTTSWRDGLAFCAIIHHFRPDLIDFSKLIKGNIYYNNDLAFTVAEKHLGIPALLEPEDMVEYEVPDRLSILTYLAQFYRAFVTPQGSSPSRIVPKRPATTADRGIVSPASTSPPTKMVNRSGGVPRRDPCEKCGLPVFIAERLNVGKLLYHRTCFRCARCNSQLTLANYYETDSNQFCCETCPDEEPAKVQPTSFLDKPSVLSRSLSDEEKSASLKKKDSDDYSAVFESALENTDDPTLKKDSTLTKEFSSARSAFLTAQVVSSSESDEEMPPELPKTKPPDISGNDKISDSVNSSNKPQTTVDDSVVYRTKVSDQLKAASAASLSPVKSVTKDNPNALDSRPTSVRDRMKQFEKAQSPTHSTRSSPIRTQSDHKTSPIRASPTASFEKAQSPTQSTRSSHIRTQPEDRTSPIRASPTASFEKAQSPTHSTRSSPIRTQPEDKTSPIRASPTASFEKAQSPTQSTRSSHIRTQPEDRTSPIRASPTASFEKAQSPTQSTRSSPIRTQPEDRNSPIRASPTASFEKAQSPIQSTRSSPIRTQPEDRTSPIRASPRGSLQRKSSPAREKLESRFSPIREKSDNRFSPIRTKAENLPSQFTKSKSSSPIKDKIGVIPSNETVVDSKSLPVRRKSDNPTPTPTLGKVLTSSPTKSPRPETLSIQGKFENRSTPQKVYPDSIKSPIREKSSPIKAREDFRKSTPNLSPRKSSIELPKVSELKNKFTSPTAMEQSPKVPPPEVKPTEATPATPTNLNFLLEKQIGLKKSKTTPTVNPEKEHIPPRRPFSDISIRSPSDPQTQLPRRFEENTQDLAKSDVSALDSNLVDVGVVEEASKIVDDKCTDNVSEKLVAEDHRQVLGDGNLEDVPSDVDNKLVPDRSDSDNKVDISSVSKEPVELLHSSSKEDISVEIVNTPEVINISESIEEINDTPQTVNDSAITIEDSIIEISDDSKVEHLDESKNEGEYPEDLNPFGDEEDEDKDMNLTKSSNPFDEDEDEEEMVTKPIPAARRKVKSSEGKNACLNPFGDEDEEGEQAKTQEKPKPMNRSKIMVKVLASDGDTPEYMKNVKISRKSVNPLDDEEKEKSVNTSQKLLAAPRISLNPFWSDADEDGQEDEDEGGLPRPKPRKIRTTDTPEKQKNQQGLSTFGSSSSLSSVNSGVQSVRKKKPAPRPPILSPDRQESAQSSLTSSPNASVQHSPRLSTPKNRKTRRAPLPPSSTPNKTVQSQFSFGLTPIEQDRVNTSIEEQDWDKQKEAKDEVNRNRQSQTFANSDSDVPGNNQSPNYIPDKSTFGKWKRKKGPAPSRPVPQRRSIKQLPMTEIKKELDLIELQQQGLEKQGVRLEQIIRERCEGPNVNPEEVEPIDVDDLILQLFEVVNEKNELCRRQAELMYLRRQQRLEEEHAEIEYEIRCLMMQPEANKTDTDKAREEELINRLVNIVERRNEIIECLEMDRVRENDEDTSISNSLNTYAAKRDEIPVTPEPEILDKKEKKKKKKIKIKFTKKSDLDKDIDESETSSVSSGKEKKKKKFTLF